MRVVSLHLSPYPEYMFGLMAMSDEDQITLLLERLGSSPESLEQLTEIVYDDIRRLARHQRARMGTGETLRTTALVHEAYMKLFRDTGVSISNRQHLNRLMVRTIRQVIVDHARSQMARKRGGDAAHLPLEEGLVADDERDVAWVLDMNAAINRLAEMDSELADIVTARYFAGNTTEEIADMADISRRTVQRHLKRANAWLRLELGLGGTDSAG